MPNNHSEVRPTASAFLPDGRLVELVYSPEHQKTWLAVLTNDAIDILDRVDTGALGTLLPMSPGNNLVRHQVVVLPQMPTPFESPESLAADIEAYIATYLDISPAFLKVSSTYVLFSWVYDAFNEVPYLRFRGEFGSGKTRALTVIGSLLNKGFFASGASTVSPIFHILDAFRGALILDEADFRFSDEKAELSKILNNGNVKGFPVLRQTVNAKKEFDPKAFHVFGPKIIGARQSFDDIALESRFLTEDMGVRSVRADIPKNLPEVQNAEARALRNQLLMYRFRYRRHVGIDASLESESQSMRTNQIIVPLLSVAPTSAHREAISLVAGDLDASVRTERAASLDAALAEVVASLMAAHPDRAITVSEIASAFAGKVGADTERPITARYTGHLLRSRLRLRTLRIGGVFSIPKTERPKIEYFTKRFGID